LPSSAWHSGHDSPDSNLLRLPQSWGLGGKLPQSWGPGGIMPGLEALGALAGGAGLAVAGGARLWRYGTVDEPAQVEVTRHRVESARLPAELDGLTLCQISDLHLGPDRRNEAAITRALADVCADLYVF